MKTVESRNSCWSAIMAYVNIHSTLYLFYTSLWIHVNFLFANKKVTQMTALFLFFFADLLIIELEISPWGIVYNCIFELLWIQAHFVSQMRQKCLQPIFVIKRNIWSKRISFGKSHFYKFLFCTQSLEEMALLLSKLFLLLLCASVWKE